MKYKNHRVLAAALAAAMCVGLLAGCSSNAVIRSGAGVSKSETKTDPTVAEGVKSDGAVVWNEQTDPAPLPDVTFADPASTGGESGAPDGSGEFHPREDWGDSSYVSGDDEEPMLDSIVASHMQTNGAAGIMNGTRIRVGLNDFDATFGADGWEIDEEATEASSMSVIYTNPKYPGATLTLDDGSFDDSEGLATRIATTGFRGYSIDFGKTGHADRPDMSWMGGVTFGSSIEEVTGVYLPVCEHEYYSYDSDDYSIRSYQLSENYCVWFGFYAGEGLQFISLRVW